MVTVVDHEPQDGASAGSVSEGDRSLSVDDPGEPSEVCLCGHTTSHTSRDARPTGRARSVDGGVAGGNTPVVANPLGRLPGSVWRIPSEPLLIPDDTRHPLDLPDHFAAFPQEWPRRIITGWSPTAICQKY